MPHGNGHRIGDGASVYKKSTNDASLQASCRTTCGSRTLFNALFVGFFLFFILIFNHKCVQFASRGTTKIPQQCTSYMKSNKTGHRVPTSFGTDIRLSKATEQGCIQMQRKTGVVNNWRDD